MSRLNGKVALVTGGASGIGLATVEALACEGAKVICTDINVEQGKRVADECRSRNLFVDFYYHDVSNEAGWIELSEHIRAQHGSLDILVNNAGIALIGSVEDATLDSWRRTMQINLDGVFLGTKMAIGLMKDKGGSIINVSSVEGIIGEPLVAAYNASKGGVRIFTKSAALHCADLGYPIRINSIHPGFVSTPMVSGAIATLDESAAKAFALSVLSRIPAKRFATPEEIAKPILFLASDDSSYMQGAELVVDGGMTAR